MSITSIMNNALTGLQTNQTILRTISSNIANVNTPGYARLQVSQEALSSGSLAGGVKISNIQRVIDQFLETASQTAAADSGKYDVLSSFQDRIQSLLGNPTDDASISSRLDKMFAALAGTSSDPSSPVARQNALAEVQNFADTVSTLADQIQKLRVDASQNIEGDIGTINSDLRRIAELNPQIVALQVQGQDPTALQEQRSQAVNDLAKYMDIRVNLQPNGSITINTGSGQTLIDNDAMQLKYNGPGVVSAESVFNQIEVHRLDLRTGAIDAVGRPLDGGLNSGELKALVDLRDQVLPGLSNELGTLSREVFGQINALHNQQSAVPAPNSLTGTKTGMLGTDLQGFTGKAVFAVTDPSGMVINQTTVDFSALAPTDTLNDVINLVNTALGGDGSLSLVSGVLRFSASGSTNGVVVAQDPTTPSDRGGRGFSQFFGLNDLVASKVPTNFNTGLSATDNHGFTTGGTTRFEVRDGNNAVIGAYTLNITAGMTTFGDILTALNAGSALGPFATFSLDSNGALKMVPNPGHPDAKIRVITDSTARGGTSQTFSSLFGIGDQYLANAAIQATIRDPMKSDSSKLALATFDTSAGIGADALDIGDGSGAQAFQALQNQALSFGKTGALSAMSVTLGQYASAILSTSGLAAAQASSQAEDQKALASELNTRRENVSGVNMDEELSNMVIYQQSYAAAAKLITAAQEIYDTLLGTIR